MKNDFKTTITSKKVEAFRIHAAQGNGKVGITAWYTMAVFDEIKKDVESYGVKILKIEKSLI